MLKGKTHCLTTRGGRVRVRGGFLKSDSPNTHSTFDQLFAPCVTSLDSFFFCFRKYNNHNQRATSPKSPERCRDKDCEEFSCAIPFHTLEDPELVTKSWLLCICLPYTWLLSSHWHKSASNFHNFFGKKTKTGWEGCYCTTIIQGAVSIQFRKLFSIRSSMKMDALQTVHVEWIRRGQQRTRQLYEGRDGLKGLPLKNLRKHLTRLKFTISAHPLVFISSETTNPI